MAVAPQQDNVPWHTANTAQEQLEEHNKGPKVSTRPIGVYQKTHHWFVSESGLNQLTILVVGLKTRSVSLNLKESFT